jgi:hypothetical protein
MAASAGAAQLPLPPPLCCWCSAHVRLPGTLLLPLLPLQPLVLAEFGKNVTSQDPATIEKERNPTFRTVMGALTKSLQSGDVLKGIKVGGRGP